MLGYTTEKAAKAEGFTHHGSYHGLPIWLGHPESEAPMMAAKWAPLEYLIPLWSCMEGLCSILLNREPMFMIKVGPRIE